MKKKSLSTLLLTLALCFTENLLAQEQPKFHLFSFDDNAEINRISDNGNWAVADAKSPEDDSKRAYPKLIDLSDDSILPLYNESDPTSANWYNAKDVTDDGAIVAGSQAGEPALWRKATGKWVTLPKPSGWSGGCVNCITPDGKYAAGTAGGVQGNYTEAPVVWDIAAGGRVITPEGLPEKGMTGALHNQSRITHISADGRYLLGCVAFSYLQPTDIFFYVYDRQTNDWEPIGFDLDKTSWTWTPQAEGLLFIEDAYMDHEGKYVTGIAYMVKDASSEYRLPFLYDVAAKKFTLYDESQTRDYAGYTVDGQGHVFAASPAGSPTREWSIRVGEYWYSFSQILKQRYGMEYKTVTGFNITGTPLSVTPDGKTVAVLADPVLHKSYVVSMSETFEEAAQAVNLLDNYTTTPAQGATFSRISSVQVTFDRAISVKGDKGDISLKGDKGHTLNPIKFGISTTSDKTAEISFRTALLNDGETYTLHIPAGVISLADNAQKTNNDIDIVFYGRENKPMSVVDVSPRNGSMVSQLNYSTNPMVFTFDCTAVLTDSAKATLYIEGRDEPVCDLSLATADNKVAAYPATGQYLYKGSQYKVVLQAGAVTDVTGFNPNEAYTVNYTGSYEREIADNDTLVYSNNFNSGVADMLLYDNDKLEPTQDMVNFGFEQERTPWMPAWDEDNTSDLCAASNSQYKNGAGPADDWMATPQMFIPDSKCYLRFKAQNADNSKQDELKVVVLATDDLINALDKDNVERFKKEGKIVYEGVETAGKDNDMLQGDWTNHVVDLAEFAGKNIYIAFWNNNHSQSILFVDNIEVVHDMKLIVTLDNEATVVNTETADIRGRVAVKSDLDVFHNLELTLKNSQGETVDHISESGLELKKGDVYEFQFSKPLPLAKGQNNLFYVSVNADDNITEVKGEVKNLAFKPVKRVVIEEYTGMGCGNCPLGILAMEKLENTFGNLILPVAIHTYSGDPYVNNLGSYTTFLFGNSPGAPSASINRRGTAYHPMASLQTASGTDYVFNAPEGTDPLWLDVVTEEFATEADADISAKAEFNSKTGRLDIPCEVKFALNDSALNINLFAVVLEDNLVGYQSNYMANTESESLGEWGKGGKYGMAQVIPYYFNDVALACIGMTFNGTGGYLPEKVEAGTVYDATVTINGFDGFSKAENCKVVVMMIDANTGRYINAAEAKFTVDGEGGDAITETGSDSQPVIICHGQAIDITAADGATAELISVSGHVIDRTVCQGNATLRAGGYKGMAVVRVVQNGQATVRKVVLN